MLRLGNITTPVFTPYCLMFGGTSSFVTWLAQAILPILQLFGSDDGARPWESFLQPSDVGMFGAIFEMTLDWWIQAKSCLWDRMRFLLTPFGIAPPFVAFSSNLVLRLDHQPACHGGVRTPSRPWTESSAFGPLANGGCRNHLCVKILLHSSGVLGLGTWGLD